MNTKAVYTVHENNRDYYFFTHYAGGFSAPFATARTLFHMHDALNNNPNIPVPMSAAPLLPQLTGDISYPPESNRKLIFRQIADSDAAVYMDRNVQGDAIPYNITIDMDKRTIAFEFNPLCKEIALPDIKLPVFSEPWERLFLYNTAGKEVTGWQAKEDAFRKVIEGCAERLEQTHAPTQEMGQSM